MTETEKKYPVTAEVKQAMATIKRGVDTLLIEADLEQKLARSQATGEPLRCKLGLDPTAPDIHIGHTVVLNKLRQSSPRQSVIRRAATLLVRRFLVSRLKLMLKRI